MSRSNSTSPVSPDGAPVSPGGRVPLVLNERYEVGPLIAGGGMAQVYRGHDRLLDRAVAVKILRPHFAASPELRDRFRREARLAASLTHTHLVNVYDVGQDGERYYIVMELLPGQTLKDLIGDRPLPLAAAVSLARQVALGMGYAHRRGLVHRDLKPQNVLIAEDGQAKVADFGLAMRGETSQLTQPGTVWGTVQYLLPEQAQGLPAGPRSDVYALGAIVYELLTGHPPFEADTAVVMMKHVYDPPPSVRERNPSLPQAVDDVVKRALAKDPSDRFPPWRPSPRPSPPSPPAPSRRPRCGRRSAPRPTPPSPAPPPALPRGRPDPGHAFRRRGRRRLSARNGPGDPLRGQPAPAGRQPPGRTPPGRTPPGRIPTGSPPPGRGGPKPKRRRLTTYVADRRARLLRPDGRRGHHRQPGGRAGHRPRPGDGHAAADRDPPPTSTPTVTPSPTITPTPTATPIPTVAVPVLSGDTQRRAEEKLQQAGLALGEVAQAYNDRVPAGSVIAQEPEPNESLEVGKPVKLTVSLGPQRVAVPDVIAKDGNVAAARSPAPDWRPAASRSSTPRCRPGSSTTSSRGDRPRPTAAPR